MQGDVLDIVDALVRAWWRESGGETFGEKQSPGFTRIVKLLYLLECWYYQQEHKRLTDLEWKYYNYGPYPKDLEPLLFGERMLEGASRDQRFRRVFRRGEDRCGPLAPNLENLINRLVKDWGCLELYQILDHVYYETAPMREAKRGQVLDISCSLQDIERPRRITMPQLDKKVVTRLRKQLRDRPRSQGLQVRYYSMKDPDLSKALGGLNQYE